MYTLWTSSEAFAEYIIEHTDLHGTGPTIKLLPASDASSPHQFHTVPTHVKEILYLDCPDLIIEKDGKPILSVEISREAGTGHNAFQRFGRLLAAAENGVPALYIYPEAAWVTRRGRAGELDGSWDAINPLIFKAMERVMRVHDGIPVLLYYFPTEYGGDRRAEPDSLNTKGVLVDQDPRFPGCPEPADAQMRDLFATINEFLANPDGARNSLRVQRRRDWMNAELIRKGGADRPLSPMTSVVEVPTELVLEYIRRSVGDAEYEFNEDFLPSRPITAIYCVNAQFRGDPYPGALSAIDYLCCRTGRTYEDREKNLALLWGTLDFDGDGMSVSGGAGQSIDKFVEVIRSLYNDPRRVLLNRPYEELEAREIPRYMMQVRFGTMYTKRKDIRMYAYFADIMFFPDGVLWREG